MRALRFRLGLIINPYAGIGGPLALKGSDDPQVRQLMRNGQVAQSAQARAKAFLAELYADHLYRESISIVTIPATMGESAVSEFDFTTQIVSMNIPLETTAAHTRQAVEKLQQAEIDLLVFVGGDGTARDVCAAIDPNQLALGVPAGVKMHSGVFAVNPQAAADLVKHWLKGDLVNIQAREVRDIDERAFREGQVRSRFYGELLTPQSGVLLQAVKQGGFETEELVLLDIADYLKERLPDSALVIWGPGSTTFHLAQNWQQETTLLGVDLFAAGQCIARDVTASTIDDAVSKHSGPVFIVVTAIGGQGHIIGRGNQQISASVLRKVGRKNLLVVATRTKLASLRGRPLTIDSGDTELDRSWTGIMQVIAGYNDVVAYPLGSLDEQ